MDNNKTKATLPKLPRFKAPKKMISVKFLSKRDKMKMRRLKKVNENE